MRHSDGDMYNKSGEWVVRAQVGAGGSEGEGALAENSWFPQVHIAGSPAFVEAVWRPTVERADHS